MLKRRGPNTEPWVNDVKTQWTRFIFLFCKIDFTVKNVSKTMVFFTHINTVMAGKRDLFNCFTLKKNMQKYLGCQGIPGAARATAQEDFFI